ncbi:hypothetical protein [Xenorhabdus mauleonii]|uniref:hypothetical protein n=1 Tax=Xenorhabdus mauleonii TaxID=351675 RepID=UPI001474E2C7|nr:hypothetical protein [Xenorhabdus mauleonii]
MLIPVVFQVTALLAAPTHPGHRSDRRLSMRPGITERLQSLTGGQPLAEQIRS